MRTSRLSKVLLLVAVAVALASAQTTGTNRNNNAGAGNTTGRNQQQNGGGGGGAIGGGGGGTIGGGGDGTIGGNQQGGGQQGGGQQGGGQQGAGNQEGGNNGGGNGGGIGGGAGGGVGGGAGGDGGGNGGGNGTANGIAGTGPLTLPSTQITQDNPNAPRAKVCNADKSMCVTMTDLGDSVNFFCEAPLQAKWLGCGIGAPGMANGDIHVGYVVNGTFLVSDRMSGPIKGNPPPPVDQQQDCKPISGGKNVQANKWISNFQRLKKTGDPRDIDIDTSKPIPIIWAYHTTVAVDMQANANAANPEFRGKLVKHDNQGKLQLDFSSQQQVQDAKQAQSTAAGGKSGSAKMSPVSLTRSAGIAAAAAAAAVALV